MFCAKKVCGFKLLLRFQKGCVSLRMEQIFLGSPCIQFCCTRREIWVMSRQSFNCGLWITVRDILKENNKFSELSKINYHIFIVYAAIQPLADYVNSCRTLNSFSVSSGHIWRLWMRSGISPLYEKVLQSWHKEG